MYEWAGDHMAVWWPWPTVHAVPWYLLLLLIDSGHENLNSWSIWSLQPLSHFWYVLKIKEEFGLLPSQKSTWAFSWSSGVFTYCSSIFRLQLMPYSRFFSIHLFVEGCLNEKYIHLNIKLKPTKIFFSCEGSLWNVPLLALGISVSGCCSPGVCSVVSGWEDDVRKAPKGVLSKNHHHIQLPLFPHVPWGAPLPPSWGWP